ncbi:MAG: hypothetical protein EBZ48_13355 [Proteobacteria bacterium]|nr:hypothetical protein [Pseudomonadota bacterium]
MGSHILSFPYVFYKGPEAPPERWVNFKGRKRSWCDKCNTLKPRSEFKLFLMYPHPSSSFALFYEPHWSWRCGECAPLMESQRIDKGEFDRLFNEMMDEYKPEGGEE